MSLLRVQHHLVTISHMMDTLRDIIKQEVVPGVCYIFADINCQPTLKMENGTYHRFDTIEEGLDILGVATR